MAITDKNIVITPNIGQAAEPKIDFVGASATLGPQTITLNVYPENNGTLSFEGSAGQLFSVTNDLTGTIFSVNDVSGIPSIEVLASGVIRLAEYSGNVLIGTATDNGTDKLQISGDVAATTFKGALTGNATTATTLQTARLIGGVSFNGSANINLPGVNTAGNQNTTGNAATATTLQTARLIGGVSFNGSANINLPGVNAAGNQNTSGNAATATLVTGTSGQLQRHDIRTIAPSAITAGRLQFGFTSLANNNSAPYADFLHLRSYTDASGGNDNIVMFNKSAIGMRIYQQAHGSATVYSSFKDIAFTDGTNTSGTWPISITGNAGTADQLTTARAINGTNFNGSANITTANWGTARTLTIGSTGKSVNGAGNVAWTLAEIGAADALTTGLANPNSRAASLRRVEPNVDNPTNTFYAMVTYGNSSNVTGQLATHFQDGSTYVRAFNSTWSAWQRLLTNSFCAVNGPITATGDITAFFSDDRLKTRLGVITDAVSKVKSLTGFYYEANELAQSLGYTPKREVGISAQDVEKILPEIVAPAPIDDQYLTIKYEKIAPLLIEAIKEQQKQIDQQNYRIEMLEQLLIEKRPTDGSNR